MTFHTTPTIQEIKNKQLYFFSRDTLKFFGQRVSDFKVKRVAGRVFIYAPSYWNNKLMGYTFYEYTKSGELKNVSLPEKTLDCINDFFSSL